LDILEYHYSKIKDFAGNAAIRKVQTASPRNHFVYQLVERYSSEFTANFAEQGKYLPKYVEREFDEFLRCGSLEFGFLRVLCGDCKHEKLVEFSCKLRGFCPICGARTPFR
jgi:ribosomal protein S27E